MAVSPLGRLEKVDLRLGWSNEAGEFTPWLAQAENLALLGDAAHPVLPFLAQGAVLALEDASVLAHELARDGNSVSEALARYEDKRHARALRVQSASRRNGRIYHLSGALAKARDTVLRKSPATLFMRQYDWLYGWKRPA